MGRLIQGNAVSLDARTADGNSSDITVSNIGSARYMLSVTQATGMAPTLDIKIEGKTKSGSYVEIASFLQVNSVSSQSLDIIRHPMTFRIKWKISGTSPSFSFEIDGLYDLNI